MKRFRNFSILISALTVLGLSAQSRAQVLPSGQGSSGSKVLAWCDSVDRVLELAEIDATYQNERGNYDVAMTYLTRGLADALNATRASDAGIFTTLAIMDSQVLAGEIQRASAASPNGRVTSVLFVLSTYDFIRNEAEPLDRQYGYPYPRTCRYCGPSSGSQALEYNQNAIISYIRAEIAMAEDTRGSFRAYTKAMELVSRSAANALVMSVWDGAFVCQIHELQQVADNLRAFGGCVAGMSDAEAQIAQFDPLRCGYNGVRDAQYRSAEVVNFALEGLDAYGCGHYERHPGWPERRDP